MALTMTISSNSAAIVVFVKTPGLSPLKTRLAAGLGREAADEFYRLSVAAVAETVATAASLQGISPYWAVAEIAGMGDQRWQKFPRIFQGTGGLGERLHQVIYDLQSRHRVVAAIGADSPQLGASAICDSLQYLQRDDAGGAHVLGRCHDGGFYLVGTNLALPSEVWVDVPYSQSETADRLATHLKAHGKLFELPALTDVDDIRDLHVLHNELRSIRHPTAEQAAILNWVKQQVKRFDIGATR